MDPSLKEAIAMELGVEAAVLTPDKSLSELENWDSVTALSIMIVLSDAIGSPVEAGEIAKLKTVGDIEALVSSKKR